MSDFSPCINYKCKAHSVVWEAPQAEEAGLLILLLLLFASARVVLLVVVVMVSVGLGGCSCACGCICGCGCWCGCGAPLLKDKRASTAWAYQRKELIKRTPRQTDRQMGGFGGGRRDENEMLQCHENGQTASCCCYCGCCYCRCCCCCCCCECFMAAAAAAFAPTPLHFTQLLVFQL